MDSFKINKEFAKKYEERKAKEELQRLKDKHGDVDVDEDSSSESEDEIAEALTSQMQKDIFRTLSAIKSHDPKIYDPSVTFYNDNNSESSSEDEPVIKKKMKPMYLKDYERKVILENEGKLMDDDSDEPVKSGYGRQIGVYDKDMQELKQGFKTFLENDESDDDDFLIKGEVMKEDKEKKDEELLKYLAGEKEELTEDAGLADELEPLKKCWTDPNLNENDRFLVNFLLKREYMDEDDDERHPTYSEIVLEEQDVESDEKQFDKEELFEHKFNHRYEEPDPDFIKSYPRTIFESVRPKDSKRALKRKEAKERKKMEKQKKKEELKQLKNLKKQEILDKLNKLKEITGNSTVGVTEDDLEEDFDPAKHDKVMKRILGANFYDQDEDDAKPVFSEDEIDDEEVDWDKWQPASRQSDGPHCEDTDFNMDADFNPGPKKKKFEESLIEGSRKKKKRKSVFAEALEKSKPLFDPKEKSFEEYIEEYYKLDYEDIVADQPCRFHYRKVIPNDFGLTVDEVLKARDKELNSWVSVKKMSQYRTEEEDMLDVKIYRSKAKKKFNVLTSLNETEESIPPASTSTSNLNAPSEKKKKKRSKCSEPMMTEERMAAYNIKPKKFKYYYMPKIQEK